MSTETSFFVRHALRAGAAVCVFVFCGASDCAPGVAVGESADCCECLGGHDDDGDVAAPGDNCLPDDISQGFDAKVEIQQCAADAGDAIAGGDDPVHVTAAACVAGDHPCADICGKAADEGVVFAE